MNDIERLASNVKTNDATGCLEWTAGKSSGYGRFRSGGKMKFAHRASYAAHHGPIPSGMHVLHRCDNPSCVNPEHLFLGTHIQNMADKREKGRQARGTLNGFCKLSEADVTEIRVAKGVTQRVLASEYGICQAQIWRIRSGKQWVHLNEQSEQANHAALVEAKIVVREAMHTHPKDPPK
jgi:hypothetical protein